MIKKDEVESRLEEINEWLIKEFSSIRTGRASPAMLDEVVIDNYGTSCKISHVAAISVLDARTLIINPWDKGLYKGIESAIQMANLGVSVVTDGIGLKISFPELSAERREIMKKSVREKLEHARVSVRKEREAFIRFIHEATKNKELGEDDAKREKDNLQKMVDKCVRKLEELSAKKELELS